MKRIARLLVLALIAMACVTAVAIAAASPTVKTRGAVAVTGTGAVLGADVNPNGTQTGYTFQYGLTPGYGYTTASRSAGHGSKPVLASSSVAGLTPGTVYHYRIAALNKDGLAYGADRTFKTSGHPPALPVTGPPIGVLKTVATVTGSVNPEGQQTTAFFQYGLSALYTAQTIPGPPLPGVSTPEPVAVQLTGLAPGKLFHYRVGAAHGNVVSFGSDQTFFTEPSFKRTPRMTTRTSPLHVVHKPYVFKTSGSLHGAGFIPASLRCTGNAAVRYYDGKRRVAFALASVSPNCTFSTPVAFNKLIHHTRTALRVVIQYRGNGYLNAVQRTDHVTLG